MNKYIGFDYLPPRDDDSFYVNTKGITPKGEKFGFNLLISKELLKNRNITIDEYVKYFVEDFEELILSKEEMEQIKSLRTMIF